MEVWCTQEFKDAFNKLSKNNSYATLEGELRECYCDGTFDEAKTGDLLGAYPGMSLVKKRFEGRGGYRVYMLVVVQGDQIFLSYVHPKTGKYGGDNVTPEYKKELLKQVLSARKTGNLFEVKADPQKANKIIFVTKSIGVAVSNVA